jgi:predicted nucleotidyltransferase
MNTGTLMMRIRAQLESAYGARLKSVVLYGSVARGEDREDSDIDILVLLDRVSDYAGDLRISIGALYPLARELGRRISAKPVPEQEYESKDCPLFRHAHREGVAA